MQALINAIDRNTAARRIARFCVLLYGYGLVGTWRKRNRDRQQAKRTMPPTPRQIALRRLYACYKAPDFAIILTGGNTDIEAVRKTIRAVLDQKHNKWTMFIDAPYFINNQSLQDIVAREPRIHAAAINTQNRSRLFDYVIRLDAGTVLRSDALLELACHIKRQRPDVLFSDEAYLPNAPKEPYRYTCKPDYGPDTLRATNYFGSLIAVKYALYAKPEIQAASGHAFCLRLAEHTEKITTIPKPLYFCSANNIARNATDIAAVQKHLDRVEYPGNAATCSDPNVCKITYAIHQNPKVSIIIPNKNNPTVLKSCIDSIVTKSTYANYEIIIIDNESSTPETFAYYRQIEQQPTIHVISFPTKGFHYSAICNFGVRHATGQHLLFLNNDIVVISPDWIQEMLSYSQRADVGACGAMLYYPNDTIQHAGIAAEGMPKNIGVGANQKDPAFRFVRNLAAVSFACCMTRKDVFEKAGPLDEKLAVAFNDVDYCLTVQKHHLRVVWTPHAELYHLESYTRGTDQALVQIFACAKEYRHFRHKHE